MNDHTKIAAEIRKSSEDRLDAMARMRAAETGEGFYEAYSKVCHTPLGKQTLQTHNEAYRLQIGATFAG